MDLEVVNKLFLELSQITTATTAKEIAAEQQVDRLREGVREVISNSEWQVSNCEKCGHDEPMAGYDYVFILKKLLKEQDDE